MHVIQFLEKNVIQSELASVSPRGENGQMVEKVELNDKKTDQNFYKILS